MAPLVVLVGRLWTLLLGLCQLLSLGLLFVLDGRFRGVVGRGWDELPGFAEYSVSLACRGVSLLHCCLDDMLMLS